MYPITTAEASLRLCNIGHSNKWPPNISHVPPKMEIDLLKLHPMPCSLLEKAEKLTRKIDCCTLGEFLVSIN
jgi:hypothetical protein